MEREEHRGHDAGVLAQLARHAGVGEVARARGERQHVQPVGLRGVGELLRVPVAVVANMW